MNSVALLPGASVTLGSVTVTFVYYKGNGLFVAPSLAVGRTSDRVELRVLLKPVLPIPGSAGLDAFNSTYLGMSLGFKRR